MESQYRRQDEIGTMLGITVDFETLGESPIFYDVVTLRGGSSMKQERVVIKDLPEISCERIR